MAASPIFGAQARDCFASAYPQTPHLLAHNLARHPLLTIDALAELAGTLPRSTIEYNRGDLPIGVDRKPCSTGLSISDTIRRIATSNSWAVLKKIGQNACYRYLLGALLQEGRGAIEAATGAMLRPQGFIFISSPHAETPYHFDPEHNDLMRLSGTKVMTQFPAGDARYAPDIVHESYHAGGARELNSDEGLLAGGKPFALGPGKAVYVPVMAPHFVRNGPASSVSL